MEYVLIKTNHFSKSLGAISKREKLGEAKKFLAPKKAQPAPEKMVNSLFLNGLKSRLNKPSSKQERENSNNNYINTGKKKNVERTSLPFIIQPLEWKNE